jgi:hypothetical protein
VGFGRSGLLDRDWIGRWKGISQRVIERVLLVSARKFLAIILARLRFGLLCISISPAAPRPRIHCPRIKIRSQLGQRKATPASAAKLNPPSLNIAKPTTATPHIP